MVFFSGKLAHVLAAGSKLSAVRFHNGNLYASGKFDDLSTGAVAVYTNLADRWFRTQVIHLPSSCSDQRRLSLGVAGNKIYICNSVNHAIYIYSLKGALLEEHSNRNASYLCAVDSSGLLEAKLNSTTLNVLTKTGWKCNIVPGLCKRLKGAVILNKKLYIACSDDSYGYLQLYNID